MSQPKKPNYEVRETNYQVTMKGNHEDNMLGHLSFRPSSHRIYNNSAMGDFLDGEVSRGMAPLADAREPVGLDVVGKPEISSCSSVTTRPLDVISLLRMIRL
jgi:hypothetical protein